MNGIELQPDSPILEDAPDSDDAAFVAKLREIGGELIASEPGGASEFRVGGSRIKINGNDVEVIFPDNTKLFTHLGGKPQESALTANPETAKSSLQIQDEIIEGYFQPLLHSFVDEETLRGLSAQHACHTLPSEEMLASLDPNVSMQVRAIESLAVLKMIDRIKALKTGNAEANQMAVDVLEEELSLLITGGDEPPPHTILSKSLRDTVHQEVIAALEEKGYLPEDVQDIRLYNATLQKIGLDCVQNNPSRPAGSGESQAR